MERFYEANSTIIKVLLIGLMVYLFSIVACNDTETIVPEVNTEIEDNFIYITEDDSIFSPPFLLLCDSMGTNIYTPNRTLDSSNLQNIYLVVWNPYATILDTFMKDGVLIMNPILGTANYLGVDPELVCDQSIFTGGTIYLSGMMSYSDTIGFPEIGTGYDLWDHPNYVLVWGQYFE